MNMRTTRANKKKRIHYSHPPPLTITKIGNDRYEPLSVSEYYPNQETNERKDVAKLESGDENSLNIHGEKVVDKESKTFCD